ncbi:VCBS repeat-containing protein [Flagellimonas sp. HSM57]|uniref:VCBS repeat-containing protein n=1 Tax=Flagellimonas sp. HSM57 TaxID=2654675 RepID=UPI0013D037EE|nr:VCBS repeat-containing protein [Flagellimonas sp. HSM57]
MKLGLQICAIVMLVYGCSDNDKARATDGNSNFTLFEIVPDSITQLDFNNRVLESLEMNGLNYEYMYNGSGVSAADFNNDGLTDLYFVSSQGSNKLFLNESHLKFKNIAKTAKVEGEPGFSTASTVVDINNDGLLDIYVCRSGPFINADVRNNELFVNQGNNKDGIPVFKEQASLYQLDLNHYSTQAAFFDYDKDGDLDLFLINHNPDTKVLYDMDNLKKIKSPLTSDRLFRNDDNLFYDVSDKAGLINDGIGFGLGISIGDLNNDSWPDVIVGHDYESKDRIYINQQDGSFKDVGNSSTGHISNFSMGNDIADFNNDGWLDFMSVDMVSEDNYGIKASMSGMNTERFNNLVEDGFHYQYMYNTLQLNNGNSVETNAPLFSDIASFSGVSSTDWSWGPLFFDMDNDGDKDLFISNGIKRDFRNVDFIHYRQRKESEYDEKIKEAPEKAKILLERQRDEDLLRRMPSRKKDNYFFENDGGLAFKKKNKIWVEEKLTATNGAAYADLDNDGDLDIITNNMDDKAFIYKNNASELGMGNYLKINLKGSSKNTDGIGARVTITTKDGIQTIEQYLSRGFQSSVDKTIHFGVGSEDKIEQLTIVWPDDTKQTLKNINANTTINLNHSEAEKADQIAHQSETNKIFDNITNQISLDHRVVENQFDDFEKEILLPHKMSEEGPALAVGDIDNDGLEDIYIGGAKGISGALYLQQNDGGFSKSNISTFSRDAECEDVDAIFFDIDGDGDQDLYVVSGGNEHEFGSKYYADRIYINNKGAFTKMGTFDVVPASGSIVKPFDYDFDGDLDLFVGGRQYPGNYPHPGTSFLLRNDSDQGRLHLTSVAGEALKSLGMVTDATWADVDGDGMEDLTVVGEWMPITFLKNDKGTFQNITESSGLENTNGWWFSVKAHDFDNDGDVDFIAGNLGLNSKYQTSVEEPFSIYAKDFDQTGTTDIVLGYYQEGKQYPLRGRECSSQQMPFIKKKFENYHSFASAELIDVYGEENISDALKYEANTFTTSYFENLGDGQFKVRELPGEAQITAVTSIINEDFNNDGFMDVLLMGNIYGFEVETPRQDAGYGLYLEGDGKGNFNPLMPYESGLFIKGDVAKAKKINMATHKDVLIVALKNDSVQFIKSNQNQKNKQSKADI